MQARNTVTKLLEILKFEKKEISNIYFYAILGSVVQLSLPVGIQAIVGFVLGGAFSTSLVVLISLVIIGVLVVGILQVNQMKLIEQIQQQLFVRYAFQYTHIIPSISFKEFGSSYLPEAANKFFDVPALQKGLAKILLDIPAATIQILSGLLLLSFYHPIFILFSILLVSVLYFILRLTGNAGLRTSLQESTYKYKVANYLISLARSIVNIKSHKSKTQHLHHSDALVTDYLSARTSHFKILLSQYWTLILFKVVLTSSMLIIGAYLLIAQQITVGQFIAAEIIIMMVIAAVEKIITNLENVYDVLTSLEKLSSIMEKQREDDEAGVALDANQKGIEVFCKNLQLPNLYSAKNFPVINMHLQAGEKYCFLGEELDAKQAFITVLYGGAWPTSGTLLLNNQPLQNISLQSLREQVALLSHQQDIVAGTLQENLTMGKADISLSRLNEMTALVGLQDFIQQLPEGFSQMMGNSSEELSPTIKKKILLLRSLIASPAMLLLEEPWQGMEESVVNSIQDYLLQGLPNTTVIVSTIDESFARRCKKVFLFETGVVREIS